MPQKFQVVRDDAVIGQHDERILVALLNAGVLRLSDTCWRKGMRRPQTLADLLCARAAHDTMLAHLRRAGIAALVVASMSTAAWWGWRTSPHPSRPLPQKAQPSKPPGDGYEIRRGEPVVIGSFEARLNDEPPFPKAAVEKLAARSRVAILSLDGGDQPQSVSAGFVVGDGRSIVCALAPLGGAMNVEIRLSNGAIVKPQGIARDAASGIAILTLEHPQVPLHLSTEPLADNEPGFIIGHAVSAHPEGWLTHVLASHAGEKRVMYQLEHRLPSTSAGAPLLTTSGDVGAVVIDPAQGAAIRAMDVVAVMHKQKVEKLDVLRQSSPPAASSPIEVSASSITEGSLIASFRNTSSAPIHGALLHVTYFPTPPEAEEAKQLESQLRTLAVQASLLEDDRTDEARANRQALREVNAKLQSVQKKLSAAVALATRSPQRQDFHLVQCELPPGIPQTVELDVNAGSQWSARITVLDVDS